MSKKQVSHPKARLVYLFPVLIGLLLITSCSYKYGSPMFGKQNLYMAKPAYDTQKHNAETYASADIGFNTGYNEKESNIYLMPGIHRARAFSFFDVAYGSFGYLGLYEVNNIPEENGGKLFYGLGGRGSANFNARIGNFNWRVIGVEGSFSKEFGSYRQMRSDYLDKGGDSLLMSHTQGNSGEFGLFTEFLFREDGSSDYLSIKAAAGLSSSFGNNSNDQIERGDEDGLYSQVNVTVKQSSVIIGGNYFLTLFSSGPTALIRQGLTLSLLFPLNELSKKGQQTNTSP